MESRRIAGVSREELDRRWQLVRSAMVDRNIDVVVASGGDALAGGYIRWFTDSAIAYRKVVAFHADGPMTIVDHGAAGDVRTLDGNDPNLPGVGAVLSVAEFPAVHYCQDHEARALVEVFLKRGIKTLGLINPGAMPHALVRGLQDGLPDVEFHDFTDAIDRMKAIKSQEEIALIRRTAAMQDACFARALREIRPGMRDHEIAALLQYEGRLHGGEGGMVLAGSARINELAFFQQELKQGRVFEDGDNVAVLIENTGPGGYFLELSRNIVAGKASSELLDAFEIVKEMQAYTLSLFKPGTLFADILKAHNELLARHGQPPERRLYAHGQGYDMVERPLVREDEAMRVEEGMCLTVHPSYVVNGLWVTVTDNYLVGPDGVGPCLHQTEQRIFEL